MRRDEIFALADRFLRAIEANDRKTIEEVYSRDCVVWLNVDPLSNRKAGTPARRGLESILRLPGLVTDLRYDVWHRELTETGYVEQHIFRAKLRDGTQIARPHCVVCQVEAGQITRIDEYILPLKVEDLERAIRGHLTEPPID